jgi:phosphoenolpyruvate-protein kinase (PTS system EI component)
MGERVLNGVPASPGAAAGDARVIGRPQTEEAPALAPAERPAEAERAARALEGAARELEELAASLRSEGRSTEGEIVETGALMARDPALAAAVESSILAQGRPAAAALVGATAAHAAVIEDIKDAFLAARAEDVRSVGRRAAALTLGQRATAPADGAIVVAEELGPAEVAELGPNTAAIALAGGGVTTHAAIVARSLGVPMVVETCQELLDTRDGQEIVVDGDRGLAVIDPAGARLEHARAAAAARLRERERERVERDLPATTVDGRRVSVLVNVAGAAEVVAGLNAGAEGVGLVRTELAFLDAREWPREAEHRAALAPILEAAGSLPVTVRVLDLGGDKTPPFLRGARARGTQLLLEHPEALDAQLRAALATAGTANLRVLLPMIRGMNDLRAAREALLRALGDVAGSRAPLLGAMVETPEAAAAAHVIAAESDFLSIGTNDLAHWTLGAGRPGPRNEPAHHPEVLALVDRTVRAGHAAGIPVEVCGEAASDPLVAPLLIGLGVDELSVGAARVGEVRAWVRRLSFSDARQLARDALARSSADEVARLARSLALAKAGDAGAQRLDGDGGVVAVGP